jgi:hypothetical protein
MLASVENGCIFVSPNNETMTHTNEFAVGNEITLMQNINSSFLHFVTIVKATEKAIQVKNERGITVWIPKSGLEKQVSTTHHNVTLVEYSFKMWLRRINEGKDIKNIFRIFA